MTETVTAVPGAPLLGERVTVRAATSTVAVAMALFSPASSPASVTLIWFTPLGALLGIWTLIVKSSSSPSWSLSVKAIPVGIYLGVMPVFSASVAVTFAGPMVLASKHYTAHGDVGVFGIVPALQGDGVLRLARGRGRQGRGDHNLVVCRKILGPRRPSP